MDTMETVSGTGLDESSGNSIDGVAKFATESRLHVSVNVTELERSVEFYRVFFGVNPIKVREGYAKFDVEEPALNFTLNEFPKHTRGEGHFGVQVKNTKVVTDAWERFKTEGFKLINEDDVECCYAVQTKLWVADPDGNRWEMFVTTEPDAEEGCGSDCICHKEFERSYVQYEDARSPESLVGRSPMYAGSLPSEGDAAIHDTVKSLYGDAAQRSHPGLCCPQPYESDFRKHIPQDAFEHNYGCGSPILKAGIKEGDTVVDLGSGVGIDCFVAAKLVGPKGKVIGVDMTDLMLEKAVEFNKKVAEDLAYDVVEFRKGAIEKIPVDDKSVDVVVSNCVLNLSPDKGKVFGEINRILADHGKIVISDIVSDRDIAEEDQRNERLWSECYTGAMSVYKLLDVFSQNGFVGLTQLDEKPWKEVAGYNLGSLTLQAYKAPAYSIHDNKDNLAIYLGPYVTVKDEEGNEYGRFKPIAISNAAAERLKLAPYAESFIVVKGSASSESKAQSSSCGDGSGCGGTSGAETSSTTQAARKETPCCDPKDDAEPCCENRDPKPDGSPCCDPYAMEQPAGCSCTQESEALVAEGVTVTATAEQADAVSGCCDGGSSGCGDSGCGPDSGQQTGASDSAQASEDCCPCETEAEATGTDCCDTGCNTCGC
ncbi:MAG: methyltransferase domain-containing protein [Candidatus Thiodiazotropha sp. (ex Epidulcina cf. delphinae)]|nr:methyltransferase domain-containing protein [Candidatus Thiodiazotropha sp. (ex Epidulcina cf. delphinae)]